MTGTVFVVGSINADACYRMAALPAPGETVIASAARTSPGGKGANQAIAAAAAGAPTVMIGVVGDDTDGVTLVAALAARGIATGSISARADAATGRAVVFVDDAGENSIVVLAGANALLDERAATLGLASIAEGDVLVLQNEVPAAANRAAACQAKAAGATVIWNAAPAPVAAADLVGDIDLLIVNEHELTRISEILDLGPLAQGSATDALGLRLSAVALSLGAQAVCTLGAAGAIFAVDGQSGHIPATRVSAVDTTAAGDTVVGYLAAHATLPMADRLRLAAGAGALTVTREGASTSIPPLGEVEAMLAAITERTPA